MALKQTVPTDLNVFALTELVIKNGGPSFPARFERVDYPHIRRCIAGGLADVTTEPGILRLTDPGRDIVLRRLKLASDRLVPYIDRDKVDRDKFEAIQRAIHRLTGGAP
jgi:hypothetical protein